MSGASTTSPTRIDAPAQNPDVGRQQPRGLGDKSALPNVRTTPISVVIPARNEEAALAQTLAGVQGADVCEVWVVDGESTDRTRAVARSCGARVLSSAPGRGRQMNVGAAAAGGEILLFLHADTILPEGFADEVARILSLSGTSAGAFRLRIDAAGLSYRLIERAACFRAKRLQWPYGDQALFMRRETFHRVGGFPDWPLMEDYDLVRRLRKAGRINMSTLGVLTSARRWQDRGVWRASLQNKRCIAAYWLGVSPQRIARWRASQSAP